MERVGGRLEKMEGHCSAGQSPQWDVVLMEGEDEEEEEEVERDLLGVRRWRELVADRKKWKHIVRQSKAHSGL